MSIYPINVLKYLGKLLLNWNNVKLYYGNVANMGKVYSIKRTVLTEALIVDSVKFSGYLSGMIQPKTVPERLFESILNFPGYD